jgi:hypothetical protein
MKYAELYKLIILAGFFEESGLKTSIIRVHFSAAVFRKNYSIIG